MHVYIIVKGVIHVFEGHVRDWRQKIQRTKGETGKVKQIVLLHPAAICLWLKWSSQYSSRSLPQRKRTSQSNNKEGRRGAHCKYTKVYFHARFMFILTWDSMIMLTSSWQMGEMEISRAVAERSLREHMGNVVEALIALTNWLLWDVWTHWTAFFLLGMTLSFSHCTYSVIKGTFFKQSLPV